MIYPEGLYEEYINTITNSAASSCEAKYTAKSSNRAA
jgi:hypothetical protein